MRINEYNNLDEFIYEYERGKCLYPPDGGNPRYMGIEFEYNGVCYRMCNEPIELEDAIVLEDGRLGFFDVMITHVFEPDYTGELFELIGWYADIYDVLDNCYIQGRPFREVIMDDMTEIIGKD